MRHCSERRFTSNLIVEVLLSFTRNYVQVIQEQYPDNGKKKPLVTLCATRWVARIDAYDHFYASFKYTVFALEVIAHNMHHDECRDQFYGCWQTKSRTDASGLLKAITDFDFIATFICAYSFLSHMSGLTVKRQKKTNDVFKALSMVSEVKTTYKRLRTNLPIHFDEIYDLALAMAEKVGVARSQRQRLQNDSNTVPMPQRLIQKSIIGSMLPYPSWITSFQSWMTSSQT